MDINIGIADSEPYSIISADGTLYFSASDHRYGKELWASDGTPEGTHLVKNIRRGGTSSAAPRQLTRFGNRLYFTANDGIYGRELWTSDGTEAGTVLIKDLLAGSGDG